MPGSGTRSGLAFHILLRYHGHVSRIAPVVLAVLVYSHGNIILFPHFYLPPVIICMPGVLPTEELRLGIPHRVGRVCHWDNRRWEVSKWRLLMGTWAGQGQAAGSWNIGTHGRAAFGRRSGGVLHAISMYIMYMLHMNFCFRITAPNMHKSSTG